MGNAPSLLWHTVLMGLTVALVAAGVAGGMERAAMLLMRALGLTLLILVGYGMTTGHFAQAAGFLFQADWSKIAGSVLLEALGHACFTLSLGMDIMLA